MSIDGKYLAGGEMVTKVEQEKKLNQLIGLRRDFRDRLRVERENLSRLQKSSAKTESGGL